MQGLPQCDTKLPSCALLSPLLNLLFRVMHFQSLFIHLLIHPSVYLTVIVCLLCDRCQIFFKWIKYIIALKKLSIEREGMPMTILGNKHYQRDVNKWHRIIEEADINSQLLWIWSPQPTLRYSNPNHFQHRTCSSPGSFSSSACSILFYSLTQKLYCPYQYMRIS